MNLSEIYNWEKGSRRIDTAQEHSDSLVHYEIAATYKLPFLQCMFFLIGVDRNLDIAL